MRSISARSAEQDVWVDVDIAALVLLVVLLVLLLPPLSARHRDDVLVEADEAYETTMKITTHEPPNAV